MFHHITARVSPLPTTLVLALAIVTAAASIGMFLPDFIVVSQALGNLSCK